MIGMRALVLLLMLSWAPAPAAQEREVRIGVLSHRGDEATLAMWSGTADYLTEALDGFRFRIVPLDFHEVDPAVSNGTVDFILVNPGIYVNLEVRYRVSRIATLNNLRQGVPYNIFGGVIFTRADRTDIRTLHDLVGKSFMAVDATSLGGYQMAWREMRAQGIEPMEDFASVQFGGTHDQVVMAVREGRVDAATVRTDILERMAQDHIIDLDEFHIINRQIHPEFPFAHSTRLYPEWPFSKVRHTSNELAQRVAVALLNMPHDHPAALAGKYAGWTIPLDYQPVHELFKDLYLPPYESLGRVTIHAVLAQYWQVILLALALLLFMVFLTTRVARLNLELQAAKARLEQQHELILNSVGDGIYGVDLEGNATFVNRAMEEITGWKLDDVIGRNQHELLHHTHQDGSPHPAEECPVYATARDSMPRFIDDDVFWTPDGKAIPVEYSSNPIRDEHGETVGAVVVFRDISSRREAEEQARRHQEELAHVTRLNTMGEMASSIAHELNQPLSAITNYTAGCIRMLRSGQPQKEQLTSVMERVAEQAERAGGIIRELRQFIRKEQADPTVVELNDLVQRVAVLIEPDLRRAGVTLIMELAKAPNPVRVYAIQIEQVIINLARNAIEAMADTPVKERLLKMRTAVDGEQVEMSVEDSGHGISKEVAGQLFDPFVTTKPQGMGLGLSISRGIIEAHDGSMAAGPRHKGGAVFRFTLPLEKTPTNET
jgi:two-component system sensor histidine kinase TtrS